ncbi:sodium/calcium exchanger regulatory protein 1-like [Oratosquilla oratoria]|uniref:sodium/calcium exchanger regulatory protein 1-like n=1 Tax=Oratosquilla oratoria TaxID=337810 RepID=UPI003F7748BE
MWQLWLQTGVVSWPGGVIEGTKRTDVGEEGCKRERRNLAPTPLPVIHPRFYRHHHYYSATMVKIVGKYKLDTSENFDEFMKALGVGAVMRKMGNAATPVVEITQDGDTFSLKTSTTFKTTEIKFKLGEKFEETTADGRVVKATVTQDGDKLTHEQLGDKEKGEKNSTLIRVFTDTEMIMECKVDDIISKRVYKRMDN